MAKIKHKINITEAEDNDIRRVWDEERSRWYFSITDIIGVMTESVDARNYWKALKNRLKNSHNQLVSECNQLKLPSSDGKCYLADVADKDTIIKIIRTIDPTSVPAFKSWFEHIDVKSSIKIEPVSPQNIPVVTFSNEKLNSDFYNENKLSTALIAPIDIYENKNEIFVKFMLAGIDPDKIILGVSMQTVTIKCERKLEKNINEDDYITQELDWGEFYRQVELPSLVDVDQIEATEFQGLINIKLIKLDQNKNRFIKIKSLN